CGRHPVGQQKVHEYEALRGGSGRRLHCWLTSFSQSLQTNLRITLDGTNKLDASILRAAPKTKSKPSERVRFGTEEQRQARALTFVKKSEQAI
ncbi:MAG: hypothetical protein MR473_06590, partial [Clostridiales bacterium]|nr:hypothetical protein [Clostridiales bacterium]